MLPILLSEVWGFCIRFTDHMPIRAERFLPHGYGYCSYGAPGRLRQAPAYGVGELRQGSVYHR